MGYVPLGVDQAKLVARVWEGFGNRLRHALEAVGDEELRIPDPPPFQGFEEIGPIARALPRHGPEIQNLPPSVPRYPDRHLYAFLGDGRGFAVAPLQGDVRPVHEHDDAFGEASAPEFLGLRRQFGDELPHRLPGEPGGGIA